MVLAETVLRKVDLKPEERAELRREVERATAEAVATFLAPRYPDTDPGLIASEFGYESLLGAYIIEQIPYGVPPQDARPRIPENHDEEGRWVRKSGVLRDNSVFNPLSEFEPIPAGQPIQFTFEDWPHLNDNLEVPEQPPDPAPEIPPGHPSDGIRQYAHNIVKTVRLRYAVKDRELMPDGTFQRGFILMAYSGGDSSG